MLIKFQRSMVIGVRKRAEAGEVADIDDRAAQSYIRQGWAVAAPAAETAPEPAAPEPKAEASPEPKPEPKPVKKSRTRKAQ